MTTLPHNRKYLERLKALLKKAEAKLEELRKLENKDLPDQDHKDKV